MGRGGSGNTGGSSATGGSAGTAGKAGTGGRRGAGGGKGTGGATATGGTTGTGGATATGGTTGTGGTTATGGSTGTGGTPGPALAFPGAQGFAKKVTGGRAGAVYHVTNLNDSGAGSFRDAVSASNRIIVFDVGGYVQLATAVSAKSNLTIAGQTAPGGGIGFRGGEISFASQSNIIMRHVRIRPGSETASTDDDALSLYRAHDVIVDHSSMEFAPWNDIDGVSDDWQNYPVTNITIQDSLIADPTGQQFGAHTESVSSDWSWYRNIFANSHNRNPLAKVDNVFVNNVLYNYSAGYTTHTSTSFKHDILNNYFIFGPASTGTDNTWFQVDMNQSIYYCGEPEGHQPQRRAGRNDHHALLVPGDGHGAHQPMVDGDDGDACARHRVGGAGGDFRSGHAAARSRRCADHRPGDDAGKGDDRKRREHRRTGQRALHQPGRDRPAEQRLRMRSPAARAPTDTDNDGMPDVWESANGSNVNADDAMTKAADGYVLVEHYINWLAGPHAQTAAGASVSFDLSSCAGGFSNVSPTYAVSGAQNGTVTLAADKHTAQFQPTAGFHGMGSFAFTVDRLRRHHVLQPGLGARRARKRKAHQLIASAVIAAT